MKTESFPSKIRNMRMSPSPLLSSHLLEVLARDLPMQQTEVQSLDQDNPWRRQWHPLQDSRLDNPVDGGAWWAAGQGVARVGHDRARVSARELRQEDGAEGGSAAKREAQSLFTSTVSCI